MSQTETGDTLLEVLIALVIISLSVVALLGVLTTSITSSAEYRSLVTVDTVLKNFAEAVKYDIELQPQPAPTHYVNCATTYQVVSEYPTTAFVDSGVTVFGTGFVNPNASNMSVILSQPSGTPITITSFLDGGPIITSASDISATFALQNSSLPGGYIPPGSYNLTMSDGPAGTVESASQLTVTPSPSQLNPATGPAGTSVTVSASGFQATTALTVTVGGTTATITSGGTTDAYGNAVVTFTVPSTATGTQSVVVSDGTYSSTSTFTVSPSVGGPGPAVTAIPSAVAGSTVRIASIAYWDNSTSVFDPTCGVNDNSGIQLITLEATGPSNVNDTLQLVVTDPTSGAPPGPTLAVSWTPASPVPGQPVTLTTTLTPGSPVCGGSPAVCYPTGTVYWSFTATGGISPPPSAQPCAGGTSVTQQSGDVSQATCTLTGSQVAAGLDQIAVSYSGDIDYGPASALQVMTVAQLVPTMTVTSSPTNPIAGEPLTFSATVTGPANDTQPTGSVQWTFTGPGIPPQPCPTPTALTGSPPTTTCVIPDTAPGTYNVTAAYSGDVNYPPTSSTAPATTYAVALTGISLNGATPGTIATGDTIALTFSAPLALGTLCNAWAGQTAPNPLTDATVTVVNGTGSTNDSITITASASCTSGGNFGSINLESQGYVSNKNKAFSPSTIAWSAGAFTLTITLGTKGNTGTLGSVSSSSAVYKAGFAIPGSPCTTSNEPQFGTSPATVCTP